MSHLVAGTVHDRFAPAEMQCQKRSGPDEANATSLLCWQGYLAATLAMTVACAPGAAIIARLSACSIACQD